MFDGQNAPNTSIAFVSGLADLRHDSSGIAVRGAGAPVRVNDGGEGSGINGMRNTEQLKDYLLTYGVGNQESYATQVSQSEVCPVTTQHDTLPHQVDVTHVLLTFSSQVDALFAAMEAVHDAKRSWENKPGDEVKQPPVEELAVSRKFDGVAQQEGNGNPSKHLVLDYQWQDEGSRVRSLPWCSIFEQMRMPLSLLTVCISVTVSRFGLLSTSMALASCQTMPCGCTTRRRLCLYRLWTSVAHSARFPLRNYLGLFGLQR